MTDTGPAPKPGILDIAPYVGGKSAIAGVAEPMKLSSNENAWAPARRRGRPMSRR
jgi:histidinol-phosphate aminotransferase